MNDSSHCHEQKTQNPRERVEWKGTPDGHYAFNESVIMPPRLVGK